MRHCLIIGPAPWGPAAARGGARPPRRPRLRRGRPVVRGGLPPSRGRRRAGRTGTTGGCQRTLAGRRRARRADRPAHRRVRGGGHGVRRRRRMCGRAYLCRWAWRTDPGVGCNGGPPGPQRPARSRVVPAGRRSGRPAHRPDRRGRPPADTVARDPAGAPTPSRGPPLWPRRGPAGRRRRACKVSGRDLGGTGEGWLGLQPRPRHPARRMRERVTKQPSPTGSGSAQLDNVT